MLQNEPLMPHILDPRDLSKKIELKLNTPYDIARDLLWADPAEKSLVKQKFGIDIAGNIIPDIIEAINNDRKLYTDPTSENAITLNKQVSLYHGHIRKIFKKEYGVTKTRDLPRIKLLGQWDYAYLWLHDTKRSVTPCYYDVLMDTIVASAQSYHAIQNYDLFGHAEIVHELIESQLDVGLFGGSIPISLRNTVGYKDTIVDRLAARSSDKNTPVTLGNAVWNPRLHTHVGNMLHEGIVQYLTTEILSNVYPNESEQVHEILKSIYSFEVYIVQLSAVDINIPLSEFARAITDFSQVSMIRKTFQQRVGPYAYEILTWLMDRDHAVSNAGSYRPIAFLTKQPFMITRDEFAHLGSHALARIQECYPNITIHE